MDNQAKANTGGEEQTAPGAFDNYESAKKRLHRELAEKEDAAIAAMHAAGSR